MDRYGLTTDEFIRLALEEDTGDGDHSSLSTIDAMATGTARVKSKEDGVIAGIDTALKIFHAVDSSIELMVSCIDGSNVMSGDVIITAKGNVRSLLKAERLVLNCIQRMSGIASMTRRYVDAVAGTGTIILDTRKTTPNFRLFEKQAVKAGGGQNHRFGLYDMILIKDNHVDAAGGIRNALTRAAEYMSRTGRILPVEIETRNLKEVEEVLNTGIAGRIMLDNFDPDLLKEAIISIGRRFETEASGGITLPNIRAYALTGVDYISVGALTHSYKSMDISMKIMKS